MNILIYSMEVLSFVIAVVILCVVFRKKNRKKGQLAKSLWFASVFFFFLIGLTFILERPEMHFNSIKSIEANSGEVVEKPLTTYHFRDVTKDVRVKGNINYHKVGKYTEQYEIDTLTGKYVQNQTVNVVDTIPAEITLEGEEEYKISYTKEYEEPGYTAIDLCDGDITEKVQITREEIDEEHYNICYEVEDEAGNISKKIRRVAIIDDIPPLIKLNGSNMKLYIGEVYTEKGAKAEDEKDGDISENITIDGHVDSSKEGTYKITYKVSDSSGNETSVERTIVVVEKNTSTTLQDGSNGIKGTIYLTFDDGPSSSITPKILDILKEKDVKATFFILNYDSNGEELVKREIAEGHTVGIHGYSHEYSKIYQSVDIYMENITKLQDKILASTGYNATITRFPGGSSNTVSKFNPGIMTRLSKEVINRGYKYFDWNVSSGDAGGAKTSSDVYNNVTQNLSKTRANVVLMHDFSGNTKTLNALADIIDFGIENGYIFSNITEDTQMVTHGISN